jgi:hypothetical protein
VRFKNLLSKPDLDYEAWSCISEKSDKGVIQNNYRFTGKFESMSDGMIWIRGDSLMVPVMTTGTFAYILPSFNSGISDPDEFLERVRWNRLPNIAEGVKVFVGGSVVKKDGRQVFASSKENPLLVIFYNGPDMFFPQYVINTGRNKNDYWNPITPYALILGAFFLITMAISFLPRPAFRLTVISAFTAVFLPLFPLFPPGVLLTVLYKQFWRRARITRTYRDLAELPDTLRGRSQKSLALRAVVFEISAWLVLLAGVMVNILFVGTIVRILIN